MRPIGRVGPAWEAGALIVGSARNSSANRSGLLTATSPSDRNRAGMMPLTQGFGLPMGLALVAGSRTGAVPSSTGPGYGARNSFLLIYPRSRSGAVKFFCLRPTANQPTLATARAIAASLDAFWRRIDQHVNLDGRPTWKHGK